MAQLAQDAELMPQCLEIGALRFETFYGHELVGLGLR